MSDQTLILTPKKDGLREMLAQKSPDQPLLCEQFFFIPKTYKAPAGRALSLPQCFCNNRSISMEICSGNGAWIVEKAKASPTKNWIAIEQRFDRASKIWSRAKREEVKNLFVIRGEALFFITHYLQSDFLAEIFINFPDPWPKRRHEKNRLIKPPFLQELSRVLQKQGVCTFVTDDIPYRDFTVAKFLESDLFYPLLPAPFFVTDYTDYGASFFEELWRRKGKSIFYIQFQKKDD